MEKVKYNLMQVTIDSIETPLTLIFNELRKKELSDNITIDQFELWELQLYALNLPTIKTLS